MTKARLIITFKVEYDVNPNNYPKNLDDLARLNIDIHNTQDDPYGAVNGSGVTWVVSGELVDNENY